MNTKQQSIYGCCALESCPVEQKRQLHIICESYGGKIRFPFLARLVACGDIPDGDGGAADDCDIIIMILSLSLLLLLLFILFIVITIIYFIVFYYYQYYYFYYSYIFLLLLTSFLTGESLPLPFLHVGNRVAAHLPYGT